MVARIVAALCALGLLAGCGGGDDKGAGSDLAEDVTAQLAYLDPASSSVVAVDLRFGGENWKDLADVAERVLEATGRRETLAEALGKVARDFRQDFEKDIRPNLDGRLVIGTVLPADRVRSGRPEPVITAVYTTGAGDLRRLAERDAGADAFAPVPGHEGTVALKDGGLAIVGRRTLVISAGGEVTRALDRAEAGRGVSPRRLADAEADTGMTDPLVLAAGDLTLARALLDVRDFERAREVVPYLRALRRGSAAIDVDGDGVTASARLVTDEEPLEERDLPVAPAGDVEIPEEPRIISGGNRDQSYTTTFGARAVRAMYPDSRFARAVAHAERELGIDFEEEVLRQFSCPSVSLLEPPPTDGRTPARFGARSCVADPERMRALLPRLRPHLPAILTGLQGLGDVGLTALLLFAPDAPLVPGLPLAQIQVSPAGSEDLYEITGLRDDESSRTAQAGPDRVVFGLIGDAFVVASDEEMARRAAEARAEELDEQAGGAVRIPVAALFDATDRRDAAAYGAVFEDLVGSISAEPEATVARLRLALKD